MADKDGKSPDSNFWSALSAQSKPVRTILLLVLALFVGLGLLREISGVWPWEDHTKPTPLPSPGPDPAPSPGPDPLTSYVEGVAPKIREVLVSDRDSGDANGIAG